MFHSIDVSPNNKSFTLRLLVFIAETFPYIMYIEYMLYWNIQVLCCTGIYRFYVVLEYTGFTFIFFPFIF